MSNLSELREQIQDDIIACVDGYSFMEKGDLQSLTDNLCQIVVDRINERLEPTGWDMLDEVIIEKAKKWDEHVSNLAEHGGV